MTPYATLQNPAPKAITHKEWSAQECVWKENEIKLSIREECQYINIQIK